MAYKKCPRCSLNYIKDTDVLCKVCMEDVGKVLRSDDDDEEEYDICPECGENIIRVGEEMCYSCMMEDLKQDVKKDIYLSEDTDDSDEDLIIDDDEDLDALEELEELEESEDLAIIDEDFDMDDLDEDDY